MTTKDRIMNFMQGRDWTAGSVIEAQADYWFTKPSVVSRRCRELVNEGKLERQLSMRRTVQYRVYRPQMTAQQANQYLEKLSLEEERTRQIAII